ncbi:MAG: hypothetical protein EKE20_15080 [Candidatus Symbiopectobacterium sp. Dall1.0]|uniref:hypothetical protein n=1 Tax=Sodalis praecaptivus TaxID=1239307 RepID=UPI001A279400|nr:hypothetical protein [Candidatus Symbiopectobacterium sp. Dall1.0]
MTRDTFYTQERIDTVNKLVSLVCDNFSYSETNSAVFAESMWIALQMLSGPMEAAMLIRRSQIAEG